MSSNITSANATAVMIINDLFPVGFAVEGFATDQAINQDEETLAVTRMGVDGKLSAGYTPVSYTHLSYKQYPERRVKRNGKI